MHTQATKLARCQRSCRLRGLTDAGETFEVRERLARFDLGQPQTRVFRHYPFLTLVYM